MQMLLIYRLSLKQVLYAHVQAVFLSPVKNLRLKNDNYRKSKIRNSFTTTNSSKLPAVIQQIHKRCFRKFKKGSDTFFSDTVDTMCSLCNIPI